MEDSIEVILQDHGGVFPTSRPHPIVSACTGALLTGFYGVWSLFSLPGFRKIPMKLKCSVLPTNVRKAGNGIYGVTAIDINAIYVVSPRACVVVKVPYLPSSKNQTQNVMKLLEGRRGRLADLGSGDGRLVFAASAAGFQSTGFEINSILVTYAQCKAYWGGIPSSQATFVKCDFWKTDLSSYNNVTAFLAPGVMEALEEKLLTELPEDACVISCRFPIPNWPEKLSSGSGLDKTYAYDIGTVRSHCRNPPSAASK